MTTAASGFVYLFGDGETLVESGDLELRVVAQTNTTITLGWTPPPEIIGYRFSREGYVKPDGTPRYSHTFNPDTSQVKFAKDADWYHVEALAVVAQGTYPPAVQARAARVAWAALTVT